MSDSVIEKGYAKLNLSLNIIGKRGEKHELRMLDQTIDLYDVVALTRRADDLLTSDFKEDNSLVVLSALQKRFSFGGADIRIEKKIPVGGGLGGSSADAAATALAAAKLFSLPLDEVKKEVAPLFGDIAFQMEKGTALAEGFGEIVTPLPSLPPYYVLLCFPSEGVLTKDAFALSDRFPKSSSDLTALYEALSRGERAQEYYANALLPASCSLNGEISFFLKLLSDERSLLNGMTGSGSTLFALYKTEKEAKEKAAKMPCKTAVTRFSRGI